MDRRARMEMARINPEAVEVLRIYLKSFIFKFQGRLRIYRIIDKLDVHKQGIKFQDVQTEYAKKYGVSLNTVVGFKNAWLTFYLSKN
jgi:hypothetical protein